MERNLYFRIIFLAALMWSGKLFAQEQIIFDKAETNSFLVRSNSPGPDRALLDEMITMIAVGNNKSPSQTEFVFQFEKQLRLVQRDPQTLEVSAALAKFRFTGDVNYRTFPLYDVLRPSSVDALISVKRKSGEEFYQQKFTGISLTNDPSYLARFTLTDSGKGLDGMTLEVKEMLFRYDANAKAAFNAKVNLIEDYHQDIQRLKEVREQLFALNPDQLEQLRAMLATLDKQDDILMAVGKAGYMPWLQADPSLDYRKVAPKQLELTQISARLRAEIQDKLRNLPALHTERGRLFLKNGNLVTAAREFNLALEADPAYPPAHLELAGMDLMAGNRPAASGRLKNMLNHLNPSQDVRQLGLVLATDIVENYMQESALLTQQGAHEQSLLGLMEAYAFARDLNGFYLPNSFLVQFDKAKQNVYLTYLQTSFESLTQGDLAACESWLDKAYAFQRVNQQAIPTTEEADELRLRLKEAQYQQLIAEGRVALEGQRYEEARDKFTLAHNLSSDFPFEKDPELPELEQQAAKPLLLAMGTKAAEFARVNQLQQAFEMKKVMESWRETYDLGDDAEVKAILDQLNQAISTKECENTRVKFVSELRRAQDLVREKKYLDAESLFDQALSTANLGPNCDIDYQAAIEGKKAILPVTRYLKKMQIVEEKIDKYRFDEAVLYYNDAGNHFQQENIASFGLVHQSLEEYGLSKFRKEFAFYLAKEFANQQKYATSMKLVRKLLDRRFNRGRLTPLLEQLGEAYAEADFRNKPGENYKILLSGHVGNTVGMGKFKSAYKKRWKYLKKK
ncbi:MAG: hypothetical protein H6581_21385 [Bacteroidia bacterium]|nr:hypothetical protein [Bacteroidia bacterium]